MVDCGRCWIFLAQEQWKAGSVKQIIENRVKVWSRLKFQIGDDPKNIIHLNSFKYYVCNNNQRKNCTT